MTTPSRQLWTVLEPYHALTYFAPEARAAFEAAGLRGFWRGYFAGRAAPLGPVGPGPVCACFHGFHPGFVARALPSIWAMAEPRAALAARLAGAQEASRRVFPERHWESTFAEAADLARAALEACSVAGRPLFAANRDLKWPTEPARAALWHAATLLREHRGDGHVAALVAAGLDPCEAHLTQVAANGLDLDTIAPYRGWADEDWAAAASRLRSRGWLDGDGHLTPEGRTAREPRIEVDTDRLAAEPIDHLGHARFGRLVELLTPVAARLAETGTIPYPNPIGLPDPR